MQLQTNYGRYETLLWETTEEGKLFVSLETHLEREAYLTRLGVGEEHGHQMTVKNGYRFIEPHAWSDEEYADIIKLVGELLLAS